MNDNDKKLPTEYIGDGVYVSFDGYGYVVWTRRGFVKHYIVFEPLMLEELNMFVERIKSENTKQKTMGE